MDQFILDNAKRFQFLVAAFKPQRIEENKLRDAATSSDVLIAARIRPILPDEVSQGYIAGVIPRPALTGSVDVHELRKKVKGPPVLSVSVILMRCRS